MIFLILSIFAFIKKASHPSAVSIKSTPTRQYIYYSQEIVNKINQKPGYVIFTDQNEYKIEIENNQEKRCIVIEITKEDVEFCQFMPQSKYFLDIQYQLEDFLLQNNCQEHEWYNNSNTLIPYEKQQTMKFKINQNIYEPVATAVAFLVATPLLSMAFGKAGWYLGVSALLYYNFGVQKYTVPEFNLMIEFNNNNINGLICNGVNPSIQMINVPKNALYYYLYAQLNQIDGSSIISWYLYDQVEHTINEDSDANYIAPDWSTKSMQVIIVFFEKKLNISSPDTFYKQLNNNQIKPVTAKEWVWEQIIK